MKQIDHNGLAALIHSENILRGWWKQEEISSLNGPILVTIPRNIGELLCLIHSEISEAWEGYSHRLWDDHLPQHSMFAVELADTAIRCYDVLGFYAYEYTTLQPSVEIHEFPSKLFPEIKDIILYLHSLVDSCMEAFRKNNIVLGKLGLWRILDCLYVIAESEALDLPAIMNEKRFYNGNRQDHKLAERAKTGGKLF